MNGQLWFAGRVPVVPLFLACSSTNDTAEGAAGASTAGDSGGAGGTDGVIYYPDGTDPDDEFAEFDAYTHVPLETFCDTGRSCPTTLAEARDLACEDWDASRWLINEGCGHTLLGYNAGTHSAGFIYDDGDQLVGSYFLDDVPDECGVWNQYPEVMPEPCFDIRDAWGPLNGGAGGVQYACGSGGQGGAGG